MVHQSIVQRILASVDVGSMLDAAQRLVRIPSWGGRESAAQHLLAELMEEAGLDVDSWGIDLGDLHRHPDCSWEIDRTEALGVVGELPGHGSGPTLLLNGHVDVVPPGDPNLWSEDPFSGAVRDGRLHGRGSLDMKGSLMAGLFALRALREAGITLAGTVRLQSVIGEEDGGLGTLAALLRGHGGDGAIVMEPTELSVAPVSAGCLNFRITVPGLAAHGAVREEGVSAFSKLSRVFDAIEAVEEMRNANSVPDALFRRYNLPFPISVGTIVGGDWASSVPDHVTIEGRLGVRPNETFEVARRSLEEAITGVAAEDPFLRKHPPRVEWWGGRFHPVFTPSDAPLVTALVGAAEELNGARPIVEGVTFGSDAGLLQRVGGMPVVVFGAGDIRDAHRPDESVAIGDLEAMAKTIALAAVRFCGIAETS